MPVGSNETVLLRLELDVSKLLDGMQKSSESIDLLKKQIERAKLDLNEMQKAGVSSGATYDALGNKIKNYEVELKSVVVEQKGYEKQLLLSVQGNKAAEGSYEKLLRQYQLASIEFKNGAENLKENADGTFELTEKGKAAAAQIAKMKEGIILFDQSIKDGRTNVGNYKSSIDAALASFTLSKDKVNDLKLQIADLNVKIKSGAGDQAALKEQVQQLGAELERSQEETANLGTRLGELKNIAKDGAEEFKSLRARMKEARDEATIAQDKFTAGLIDEDQLISAQRKVSDLAEEVGDFNKRIEALNPEAKFKAFTQVAAGIAGGISVINGGLGLMGVESEDAAKALLKVQQFSQVAQGLNQFAELGDSIKNLKIALGFTTTAQKAQTVAQVESTVATEAGAVANVEMEATQVGATGTTKALTVAMGALTSPLGIITLSVAALVAGFEIYDEIVEEVIEKTEALVTASDASLEAAKHTVEVRNEGIAKEKEAISQKLALMQSEGRGESELLNFKIRSNNLIQGIQDDALQANINNIAALEDLEQRSINASRKAKSDDEKKTLEDKAKSLGDQIKLLEKANDDILSEQQKADNELLVQQNNLIEKQKQIAEQTSTVRIGLIQNQKQREIAAEVEGTKETIRNLEKAEGDNAELLIAIRAASAQKIKDINLKFAMQEVQEKNALEIASTIEGTEARINAEISGEQRLRAEKLKQVGITETAKQEMLAESNAKIAKLEDDKFALVSDRNKVELKLIQDRRDAELAIQKSKTAPDDLEGQFLNQLAEINIGAQKELETRNQLREDDLAKNKSFVDQQISQLQFSKEFQAKNATDQANEIAGITEEGRKTEAEINATYDAQNLATTAQASQAIVEATQKAEADKLAIIVDSKQLALEAANPQEEYQAKVDLLNAQYDAEVQAAKNSISNAEELAIAKGNIDKKYAKAKEALDNAVNQNAIQGISATLGEAANLFKQHTAAYKIISSAKIILDTYASATAAFNAMAGIPYVGPALGAVAAGVAIASGLANLAKVNGVQFKQGGFSDQGGHTGYGNPNDVSTSVGIKPYTYHKREYIAPAHVIETARGKALVNELEEMRVNRVSVPAFTLSKSYPVSIGKGYAEGGYSPNIFIPASPIQQIDVGAMQEAITKSVIDGVRSLPPSVVIVEDINTGQERVSQVAGRADI